MTLADHPRLRLGSLCALYTVQGIPTGFATIAIAAFLSNQGYSTGQVAAFIATTQFPWAMKLVYGPVLDRYSGSPMGRRRPWLLFAQLGMAATLLVMMAIPDLLSQITLLTALMFVGSLFNSMQDVAADGMAVDLLEPEERGFANGAMWSGKVLGIAIGGAGLSAIMASGGLPAALACQLGILLAVTFWLALLTERQGDQRFPWSRYELALASTGAAAVRNFDHLKRELTHIFRSQEALPIALLALTASLPTRMLTPVGPSFLVQEVGWTAQAYALFAGGPLLIPGAIGALLGGKLVDRFGFARTSITAVLFTGVLFITFALSSSLWTYQPFVMGFLLAGICLDMTLKMTLCSFFMSKVRPSVGATHFTVYMTLGNLCNVLGSAAIIPLDFLFGFQGIFLAAGLFTIPTLFLLRRILVEDPLPQLAPI